MLYVGLPVNMVPETPTSAESSSSCGCWGSTVRLSWPTASAAALATHLFSSEFTVLVLTFKTLYSLGLVYLRDCLLLSNPTHHLRSYEGPADCAATKRGEGYSAEIWMQQLGAGPFQ